MDHYSVLMALGIRVREVQNFVEGALWVAAIKVLFVDAELSPDQRDGIVCDLLGRVAL